jgi:3-deoxy-D-manno-octulosonate 8-phosphate phosphatase (KDO 8-P phosphatase)
MFDLEAISDFRSLISQKEITKEFRQSEQSYDELRMALAKIRLLALDVDGVLTDGSINIGPDGEVFKAFDVKDGLGISVAQRNGLRIAIITGRRSEIIHHRCEELGITLLGEGISDKQTALVELSNSLGLSKEQIAYMGDDLNDLPAFAAAGISFAPANASMEVLALAKLVTRLQGGHGAVREAITMILAAQGKWEGIINAYLRTGQGDKQ